MPRGDKTFTADQLARIVELLDDGMTLSWIADDIEVPLKRLKRYQNVKPFPQVAVNAREFGKVWSSIRKRPALFALHCELRPAEMNG